MHAIRTKFVWSVLALAASTAALAADGASGTISFHGHAGAIKHAWMVRGPDEMDAGKTVLRIYLSSADIGAKIKACKTLSCADAALEDGAMIDYGDASHLAYAVRLEGERVQYSGATDRDAFTLSTTRPDHLAGKLHIDDSAAGGAKIDAQWDVALANTFAH